MTDAERADLRLRAWLAIEGWGTKIGDEFKIGDKTFPDLRPHDWKERLKVADQLFAWMTGSVDAE